MTVVFGIGKKKEAAKPAVPSEEFETEVITTRQVSEALDDIDQDIRGLSGASGLKERIKARKEESVRKEESETAVDADPLFDTVSGWTDVRYKTEVLRALLQCRESLERLNKLLES